MPSTNPNLFLDKRAIFMERDQECKFYGVKGGLTRTKDGFSLECRIGNGYHDC